MPIDLERLRRQRRYEDPTAGVSEEFLERRLGDGRTLAILSRPLARPRPLGWVISPSIGPEHGNLRRLETLLARGLAGAGFPTLRLRPDLDPRHGAEGQIDVSARLADVEEAVGLLLKEGGASAVGLLGAASGGMVAARAADRLAPTELALVEPVVRGKRYIRETIRRQAVAELIAAADGAANGGGMEVADAGSSQRPLEELAATGETFVRGLRLSREEYDRICEIDLVDDVRAFRGRSLLVAISPTGAVPTSLEKLVARLEALEGEVTLETLEDPLPAPFGEYPFRNAGPIRIDTRLELDQRLTDVVTAWALGGRDGPDEGAA
jgi:hypothetical protein